MTLNVQNPDQFKVVKKGDQVEVTYTEALALSVEPAPKPAAATRRSEMRETWSVFPVPERSLVEDQGRNPCALIV